MSAVALHQLTDSQVEGYVEDDQGTTDNPLSLTTRCLTIVIRGYQAARSGRPTGCRYLPSCSEYAVEAVEVHGPGRGFQLTVRRIARCGPWGGHGIDPVPERSYP
jgi:putative membrane protein insertion efficiency factor